MSAGTRDVERCSVTGREERRLSQKVLIRSSSARRDGHNATRLGVWFRISLWHYQPPRFLFIRGY